MHHRHLRAHEVKSASSRRFRLPRRTRTRPYLLQSGSNQTRNHRLYSANWESQNQIECLPIGESAFDALINKKLIKFVFQANGDHYYETLQMSYQMPTTTPPANRPTPLRSAPLPPISPAASNTGTLSHYHNDFIGIPFVLNPKLRRSDAPMEMPQFKDKSDKLDYDFQLERQVLCNTRSENRKSISTNPFF